MTTTRRPSRADLLHIVDLYDIDDVVPAVLHLATPVDVLVGPDVFAVGDGWQYGEMHFPSDDPLEITVDRVVAAVMAQAPVDAEYLDLAYAPHDVVKVQRSGTRHMVFGMGFFGSPMLVAASSVPTDALRDIAGRFINGEVARPDDGGLFVAPADGQPETFMVSSRPSSSGTSHGWMLTVEPLEQWMMSAPAALREA